MEERYGVNGVWTRFTNRVAHLLEPGERENVLGDLAESNESGMQAFAQVLGLVVRRQVDPWRDWQPWIALFAILAPSVLILNGAAARASHLGSIYGWLYLGNWSADYLTNPGARSDLIRYSAIALVLCALAVIWSCALGFAVASIARRAPGLFAILAAAILFGVEPRSHGLEFGANAAAFHSLLGRFIPVVFRLLFVLAPLVFGLSKGAKLSIYAARTAVRSWLLALTLSATVGFDWVFRFHPLR